MTKQQIAAIEARLRTIGPSEQSWRNIGPLQSDLAALLEERKVLLSLLHRADRFMMEVATKAEWDHQTDKVLEEARQIRDSVKEVLGE